MSSMFESDKLSYRAYEPLNDFDTLHAIRTNADAFRQAYWDDPVPQSVEDTNAFATRVRSKYILFVIIYLKSLDHEEAKKDNPIGYIGLSKPEEMQTMHRNTRVSINIVPNYQGKGYGTEAIQWSLGWAFRVYGMHRVMLRVHERNQKALNLYRKLEFQEEGIWREHFWYEGRFWGCIQLGMLDRKWEEKQMVK
ncbi:hypothetical protein M409DRAFT_16713 [Zasmidium cellare ATCC 36951]|uniref:N-acetyltransferase domain-containing protein n=1 Tax=Zasmidium cellare ATCC 36951 TaxID=1080233 RepID=A0A6A6D2U3_ZASCE|nr:uncharacterized protein M409DRAFT_16713 [Zasmidium cellare ATCC 36951]KAF2172748.1 hypothetical protein M409DRAFT_16713 [Zasmidium cellare ATCC 36951]